MRPGKVERCNGCRRRLRGKQADEAVYALVEPVSRWGERLREKPVLFVLCTDCDHRIQAGEHPSRIFKRESDGRYCVVVDLPGGAS
jgi:hypothetical protein